MDLFLLAHFCSIPVLEDSFFFVFFNAFYYSNSHLLSPSVDSHLLFPLPTSLLNSLFLKYLFLSLTFLKGSGKQRPEQRKDLPDLPDSESGKNGTERDKHQEMDTRTETSIWRSGYMKNLTYMPFLSCPRVPSNVFIPYNKSICEV